MLLRTILAAACCIAPQLARDSWKSIEAPLVLDFPRDHGTHLETRTEWWYATGLVTDDRGRRFGYQVTIFRQGLDARSAAPGASPLRARHALAAHVALAEIDGGRFRHAERLRRLDDGLARLSSDDLDAVLEDVVIRREADGALRIRATEPEAGFALDLRAMPVKPLVLHGDRGVSRKGDEAGNASAYASFTRLDTSGSLTIDAARHDVRGASWFDHEWGSSQLGAGVVGWDWFGLRLDDGRELMVYRLRRAGGSATAASAATLVERDGTSTRFDAARIALTTRSTWTSPRTRGVYPSSFALKIDSAGLDLVVEPFLADCEVDGSASTGVVYWEGPVRVSGSATGEGFGELVGYAGSLAGRF